MSQVRVCFLGTPEFAVKSLKAILEDEHFKVVGVVTQPDRPSGRKLLLTPSPVKSLALDRGLKVVAPESLKNNQMMMDEIRSWSAEIAIVVAFGQILSEDFMRIFKLGAVNVHGSLLPRWRGAAPIQRALEAGDPVSGVSLQKMVKKLDAGDVIGERRVDMSPSMDAQELHDQLAFLGADLLKVELMDYIRGHLAPKPQDESLVTLARKINKSEAEINWNSTAQDIHNKVRAFIMGPGTYTLIQGKKTKISKTIVTTDLDAQKQKPGVIVGLTPQSFSVQCGSGILEILELQPESRTRMPTSEFLKGHSLKNGDIL